MDQEIINAISDSAFFQYFYDETDPGEPYCPKAGVRIERHADREILMTVAGETDFVMDGKYFRSEPGCVFFIDHWVPHKLAYLPEETDFMHIWIHLHKDKLYASMFNLAAGVRVGCRDLITFPSELYCLLNKRWEMMKNSTAKQTYRKNMIQLICGEMELNQESSLHASRSNNEIIQRVQNYIEINYGRNSSIADLEKFSGYNRYYLMRLFKAQTGFTILQYINQIRQRIAEDALNRNISQKEIAFQLGFSSPAAFWLWKKRRM